jgi:hypothetical protein
LPSSGAILEGTQTRYLNNTLYYSSAIPLMFPVFSLRFNIIDFELFILNLGEVA